MSAAASVDKTEMLGQQSSRWDLPPRWRLTRAKSWASGIKSPQTNEVVEFFFGTLKYQHLCRGYIGDGDALDMEVHRFRIIYNTIRPHQALADRTPRQAYIHDKARTQNLSIS